MRYLERQVRRALVVSTLARLVVERAPFYQVLGRRHALVVDKVFYILLVGHRLYQGVVTVYRGLPYELPAGIKLYSTYYASSVPARDVPAARRRALLDHSLRSREDASDLVKQLELGELGT